MRPGGQGPTVGMGSSLALSVPPSGWGTPPHSPASLGLGCGSRDMKASQPGGPHGERLKWAQMLDLPGCRGPSCSEAANAAGHMPLSIVGKGPSRTRWTTRNLARGPPSPAWRTVPTGLGRTSRSCTPASWEPHDDPQGKALNQPHSSGEQCWQEVAGHQDQGPGADLVRTQSNGRAKWCWEWSIHGPAGDHWDRDGPRQALTGTPSLTIARHSGHLQGTAGASSAKFPKPE